MVSQKRILPLLCGAVQVYLSLYIYITAILNGMMMGLACGGALARLHARRLHVATSSLQLLSVSARGVPQARTICYFQVLCQSIKASMLEAFANWDLRAGSSKPALAGTPPAQQAIQASQGTAAGHLASARKGA